MTFLQDGFCRHSAILSTVDSALLAASALLSHNLIAPLLKTDNDEAKIKIA
ncbi:hypothetical protein [Methylomicrobium sp. Wu6]|uniref:hypothetical protein n=1 Tax=Methylomicrobium sp. Wu6 TaxID=3107928 RepID=UPI002DD66C18|nr:hypothetical protein [Methylomicrobium sp. Wu6]MEC4747158.1 hypothetical protein [Methylomicrobium sp. Wu6]